MKKISGLPFFFSALLFTFNTPLTTDAAQAQRGIWKCAQVLSLVRDKVLFRKPPDPAQFKSSHEYYQKLLEADSLTNSALARTPEQKIALILSVLEKFFQAPIQIEKPSDFLSDVIRTAGVSKGVLTALEAERLTIALADYFDPPNSQGESNRLVRWALSGVTPDVRGQIEANLLRQNDLQPLMGQLRSSGLIRPMTLPEKIRKALSRGANATRIAKSVLINSVLFYIGIPLVHLPDVNPIEFAKIDADVLDTAKTSGLTAATDKAKPRLTGWRNTHAIYRGIRKGYLVGLTIWGAAYLAYHPQVITSTVDLVRTGMRLHMTKEHLKNYESTHYDSKQVVDEQLQMWLEAQDAPPSAVDVEAKRKEFETQERVGVFKIFK